MISKPEEDLIHLGKTTVWKLRRITIPQAGATMLGIEEGDKIAWFYDRAKDALAIRKVEIGSEGEGSLSPTPQEN